MRTFSPGRSSGLQRPGSACSVTQLGPRHPVGPAGAVLTPFRGWRERGLAAPRSGPQPGLNQPSGVPWVQGCPEGAGSGSKRRRVAFDEGSTGGLRAWLAQGTRSGAGLRVPRLVPLHQLLQPLASCARVAQCAEAVPILLQAFFAAVTQVSPLLRSSVPLAAGWPGRDLRSLNSLGAQRASPAEGQ